MDIEEKIKRYFSIFDGDKDWINIDKVYNMYLENGQIASDSPVKRAIFKENFIANKEKLDKRIAEIRYTKIGDIFQARVGESPRYELFDNEGNRIFGKHLFFDPLKDTEIKGELNMSILPEGLTKEGISFLCNNIRVVFMDLLKKCPDAEIDNEIIGSILKLEITSKTLEGKGENIKYYLIKSDGSLKELEKRSGKKIYR